jgi:hypothetical protein
MGTLIGFNPELKSYQILTEAGSIFNSKNVTFLEFVPSDKSSGDHDELLVKRNSEPIVETRVEEEMKEDVQIKEEEDEIDLTDEEKEILVSDESSVTDDEAIADALTPAPEEPIGRILRDRMLQVKPMKYSHFSEDPTSFKQAITCSKAEGWKKAIDDELGNIEDHEVWLDQEEKPEKLLNSTWIFKTKPPTLSSAKKQKARLCIQGFMQTYGEDFFETFAPTGKFPSLLALLVLAIDLELPIKQFDVKSAFLFAPLEEEIYIRTPEGSSQTCQILVWPQASSQELVQDADILV